MGSQNSKSRSHDPFTIPLDLILHYFSQEPLVVQQLQPADDEQLHLEDSVASQNVLNMQLSVKLRQTQTEHKSATSDNN